MRNKSIHIILLLLLALHAKAWNWWPLPMAEPDTCRDTLIYTGELDVLASGGAQAPSLLWHNTDGHISALPYSGSLSVGILKPATRPNRWFDYDGGVVLSARVSGTQPAGGAASVGANGYFRELYAHVRLYIVDITAGIHPEYYGAGDAALSSGSLLLSNNAHPVPCIRIGLDRWTPIPGLFGYAELKGGISHGWLEDRSPGIRGTLLHHKYIGARVGGRLPVNISYTFHHVAQWGGYSEVYGDLGNDFTAWKNAFLVRSGGTMVNDQRNAQGNHIGLQQLALDVKGDGWKVTAYWEAISEDGPIRFLGMGMNAKDGLWGISATQSRWRFIEGVTYEFIQTTDQSGPFHDRDGCVYGGNDNYYANLIYRQGWTYYGRIIGSPLLNVDNNRVIAHHAGIRGDIYGFRYRVLCTYADNFGTYNAPARSHNTAFLLEVKKQVPEAWNLEFGLALSGDFGTQYGNAFGALITIRKKGLIHTW